MGCIIIPATFQAGALALLGLGAEIRPQSDLTYEEKPRQAYALVKVAFGLKRTFLLS